MNKLTEFDYDIRNSLSITNCLEGPKIHQQKCNLYQVVICPLLGIKPFAESMLNFSGTWIKIKQFIQENGIKNGHIGLDQDRLR